MLTKHLPNLDPVARRHFIHLVTGILEQQSGSTRRATVCLYCQRNAASSTATWYLVANLAGEHTRFVEYACRWWQECTHKLLKSAMFNLHAPCSSCMNAGHELALHVPMTW